MGPVVVRVTPHQGGRESRPQGEDRGAKTAGRRPRAVPVTGGVARLGLVTRRPLLQRPHVAVRIVEIRVKDPAHVVDVA
jgi:hypothetical protein